MARTAFRLTPELRDEYISHVRRIPGYGVRKKSKWVCEAIQMMFDQDPQLESVGEKTKRAERSVHDTIVLDDDTQIRLGQGTIILRNAYPLWEGVKGDLIRAAIRFRMAKEKPRADAE